MAIRAICVPCGRPKKEPFRVCRACGFRPESEYQLARSLIFALERTVGGVRIGRDAPTLKALSAQIRAGRFYEFDPQEEQRALEAWRVLKAQGERRRARRRRLGWIAFALVSVIGALAVWLFLAP